MATISRPVARGDILLHRGSDERVGVKWVEVFENDYERPKDLSEWDGTFEMRCGEETVYVQGCTCTGNGLCIASIPASAFKSNEWLQRLSGEWRMSATDGERTELLAWGYYELA